MFFLSLRLITLNKTSTPTTSTTTTTTTTTTNTNTTTTSNSSTDYYNSSPNEDALYHRTTVNYLLAWITTHIVHLHLPLSLLSSLLLSTGFNFYLLHRYHNPIIIYTSEEEEEMKQHPWKKNEQVNCILVNSNWWRSANQYYTATVNHLFYIKHNVQQKQETSYNSSSSLSASSSHVDASSSNISTVSELISRCNIMYTTILEHSNNTIVNRPVYDSVKELNALKLFIIKQARVRLFKSINRLIINGPKCLYHPITIHNHPQTHHLLPLLRLHYHHHRHHHHHHHQNKMMFL